MRVLFNHGSSNAPLLLRHLQEVSSSGQALFSDLPLLSQGYPLHKGFSLINVNHTNDRNLHVVQLRNMDLMLVCWGDLLNDCVPDKRNGDEVFGGDFSLREINICDLRQADWVFNCL